MCLAHLSEEGRVKLNKDNERSKRVKELQYQLQDGTCYEKLYEYVKSNSLNIETYEEFQEELEVTPA